MVSPRIGWQSAINLTTAAASVIKAAAGLGTRHYIKSLQYQNKHATVATVITIRNGSATAWAVNTPAVMTAPVTIMFDPPLASDSNALLDVIATTTGSDVLVNIQGFSGA